ncbi:MAG TPA: hypothetical protein P5119_12985 [Candidatus Aminicenantes bacterium]|nr:hypothetical protein [Candidatus Aminicenantes bacterium]HRY66241.1 hypothetical protein [Candidatus Aminicenantes bacterium]HRZ73155.1 hypothetical protein [Candidatus Aminicenantes bacterium]
MLNTLKKFIFNGRLFNDNGDEWPVLVYLEYDKYDPSVLNCTATIENYNSSSDYSRRLNSYLRIMGELPTPVLVKSAGYSRLSFYSQHRVAVTLNVNEICFGPMNDVPFSTGEYTYLIALISAPSVKVDDISERSYLGTIASKRSEDDSISWDSDLGKIRIANYFEFDDGEVGIEKASIKIERTMLGISNSFATKINIGESFSRVENEISSILTILSLINRRHVHWYRLEATYFNTAEPRDYCSSEKRRKLSLYKPSRHGPLFHQSELKNDLLLDLIKAYRKSPLSKTIERAIMYLAGSYELDRLEAKILVAYSALEAIVNQLNSRDNIVKCLSDKHFDKLIRTFKAELQTFYERDVVDKQAFYVEDIKDKLLEIKIRPLKNRIVDVIQRYKIDCWDIWDLDKVDIKTAIQSIIRRRNKLIHDPENVDPDFLYADLVRVRALCERIILSELGFNDYDRFHPTAYNELHSIRKSL